MIFKYLKCKYSIEEAFDELEEIFSDKQVELINETLVEYIFQIKFPETSGWYVDPEINRLDVNELLNLPNYYSMELDNGKVFLQTHFHYNVFFAVEKFESISSLKLDCIIHIDDHSDMMPIYKEKGRTLTSKEKIQNGELAIGNFITNYLLTNKVDVFHIQNPFSRGFNEVSLNYKIIDNEINIGDRSFDKLEIINSELEKKKYMKMHFEKLNKLKLNYNNIWLDIDLDYFCNRYNRDSDWKIEGYFNRDLEQLEGDLTIFVDNVVNQKWFKNIKVLTIASSPGFFPREYLNIIKALLIEPLKERFYFG